MAALDFFILIYIMAKMTNGPIFNKLECISLRLSKLSVATVDINVSDVMLSNSLANVLYINNEKIGKKVTHS